MPRTAFLLAALPVVAAALTAVATMTPAAETRERCYGIAKAGANDGIGTEDKPGSSTIDFQGDAFVWVPAGACLTVAVPVTADGIRRRGALEPLDRDRS